MIKSEYINVFNNKEANVTFKRVAVKNQLFNAAIFIKSVYYFLNLTKKDPTI
jgi:hypothetical protein